MTKKFFVLLAFVCLFSLSVASRAGVFLWDDFNTPRDYLVQGLPPWWDGAVWRCGATYSPDNIKKWCANDVNGRMYIRTANQAWDGRNGGMGPGFLMYKNVKGDFAATVHITSFTGPGWGFGNNYIGYNNCGLMARKPSYPLGIPVPLNCRDTTNTKENWFSNDYFPPWEVNGNEIRYCENGYRTDIGDPNRKNQSGNGLSWNAGHWLKLKRAKDTFSAYYSFDGVNWATLNLADPAMYYRPDIKDGNGITQVGMFQCTYMSTTAWAEFDNFKIMTRFAGQAWYPVPEEGTPNVDPDIVLKWDKWDATITSHQVYISESFSDVNSGTAPVHICDTNSYDPCGPGGIAPLKSNTKYYWRVDEVNSQGTYAGDVWDFTTGSYRGDIDKDGNVDFADYAVLANNWLNQNCIDPDWCEGADLNKDGKVDCLDLEIFVKDWLAGTTP